MKQIIKGILLIVFIVSLVVVSFTIRQADQEQKQMTTDLEYRSTLTAENLKDKAQPVLAEPDPGQALQPIVDDFVARERLIGVAILDNKEKKLATSSGMPVDILSKSDVAARSMDQDKVADDFVKNADKKIYLFALPLHNNNNVVGTLVLAQNASYIDTQIVDIWKNNLIRLMIQVTLISIAVMFIMKWIIYEPVKNLVDAMRLARTDKNNLFLPKIHANFFFQPLVNEIHNITDSLFEARRSASEEARLRLEKVDSPWTAQRLQEFIKTLLKGRSIYVVSNREPYIHTKQGNSITFYKPASGMVTAIEPMLMAYDGMWVASGTGDADRQVVDRHSKIPVPPDEPKYTLKRVWLTAAEENGYYYGFCNEGLWPLCHMVHTRPVFRKEDWYEYEKVNEKFSRAILAEIKNVRKPIILVQDFHFALLPRLIKERRPDALIGLFWHIPWPNAEAFSICPWRKEILNGLLGADLIGFHTQLHCNNFVDTVSAELESLVNKEQFVITRSDHRTKVKSFPISIPLTNADHDQKQFSDEEKKKLLKHLNIASSYIGLGVDRLDYTKGIVERLNAVEMFLTKNPQYKKKFTFIQIAAPSRSSIPEYQQIARKVEEKVALINKKLGADGWKPVILRERHHSQEEINQFYRLANVCLVTSLHDGMNLVAKEFVWSRRDRQGVLILSQFTGASRELKDALIVNPYNIEELSHAIKKGIEMPAPEQKKRMVKMREVVMNNNVYRWSARLMKELVELE